MSRVVDDSAHAPLLRIENLSREYVMGGETVHALRDVSLSIERGEYVAIMGPSGSGKSTLMNLLGCLDTPSAGTYLCDGVDVASLDAEGRARLRLDKIGFVFQGFNLLPRMAMVRIGVSDGTNTEVSGDIAAGDAVIVGAQRAESKAAQ